MLKILLLSLLIIICASVESSYERFFSSLSYNDEYEESIRKAVDLALKECKFQFQWNRWDCPRSNFLTSLRKNQQISTRELAFVRAMVSSSIMITISRHCSLGNFKHCTCDHYKQDQIDPLKIWHWKGCVDNVKFAYKIAKLYLDDREIGRDLKAFVNLHNFQFGRLTVKKTMQDSCRCNGYSGSCSLKICRLSVPDIRRVGHLFKEAYKKAKLLEANIHSYTIQSGNSKSKSPFHPQIHEQLGISKNRMYFMDKSPNYCKADKFFGTYGTLGRVCSGKTGDDVSKVERRSCMELCCSCGYHVQQSSFSASEYCKCRFSDYYFSVSCKNCSWQVVTKKCVLPLKKSFRRWYPKDECGI